MTVWIAPVFVPHAGCPHRCVFCDQRRVTGRPRIPSAREVRDRLAGIFRTSRRDKLAATRQIAFYGGSFTMLPVSVQESYLAAAGTYVQEGRADSIRVSTRPDALGCEEISLLRQWGVGTVEIGIQSLADPVLEQSNRGHSAREGVEAITRAKAAGLEVGAQIMLGLPGDRGRESLMTAEKLCSVRPDFVRIYPVIVFEGTELASRMREGLYRPLNLEEAVSLAAQVLEIFDACCIPVIRIGLLHEGGHGSGAGGVLAGPIHPAFGHLVRCRLYGERLVRGLASLAAPGGRGLRLRIHPRDRCLLHGYEGGNLDLVKRRSGARWIEIRDDCTVPRGWTVPDWIESRPGKSDSRQNRREGPWEALPEVEPS